MYRFNNETGEWHHRSNSVFKDRRWLGHVSFASGKMEFRSNPLASEGEAESSWEKVLQAVKAVLDSAEKLAARETIPDQAVAFPQEAAALRWFATPSEAAACLSNSSLTKHVPPFHGPLLGTPARPRWLRAKGGQGEGVPVRIYTKHLMGGRVVWLTLWDPVAHTRGFWVPYLWCRLQAGPKVRLARALAPPPGRQPLRRGAGQSLVLRSSASIFPPVPEAGRWRASTTVRLPRGWFGLARRAAGGATCGPT